MLMLEDFIKLYIRTPSELEISNWSKVLHNTLPFDVYWRYVCRGFYLEYLRKNNEIMETMAASKNEW